MQHNSTFIQSFIKYYDYPTDAIALFTEVLEKLDNKKSFARSFDSLIKKFVSHKAVINASLLNSLEKLAIRMGYSPYTLNFVFLLSLTEYLKKQYTLLGIDDKIYYDTMADLKYKLLECIECKGVPGTFVPSWYNGFFRLERVAYGRFQYEIRVITDGEYTLKCGRIIKKGDIYLNFHIPSSGVPLTDEIRFASYREAYERVKNLFPDGKVLFGCHSWLLFPNHREFLPENLNIIRFMDDFEIVKWDENDTFKDGWRIFGKDASLPYEKLPKDTRLKKSYAEWLLKGNKTGEGLGFFLFDGEKIIK